MKPALVPPTCGSRSGVNDLKLAHHGLREEQRAILGAALAAIQRVVEVGAIDRGAEGIRTLSVDNQPGMSSAHG